MSGGHFDYKQYQMEYIADDIESLISSNNSEEKNQWGEKKGRFYTRETIREFEKAVELLRQAQIYAHRIDWLVSGDDCEENFHSRLKKDLEKL